MTHAPCLALSCSNNSLFVFGQDGLAAKRPAPASTFPRADWLAGWDPVMSNVSIQLPLSVGEAAPA